MSETFVLVHGAWHGGWAWRPVAEELRAAGHRVLTPTMPGLHDGDDPAGHHLADAVDEVVRVIEDADLHDVTLVGHSWGGYPITGAAPRLRDRLRKLVYWSAFVPAPGRALYDEAPPDHQELYDAEAAAGHLTISLPPEVWQAAFMNDAPEEVQRFAYALLVPQPLVYFTETVEPLDVAALGVPVAYLRGELDIALPPGGGGWARFARRLGVEPSPAPGSHEACFTQPAALARAFLKA